MKRALVLIALAALASGGCAEAKAKVKGRVVSNGQPMTFPGFQAAVVLAPCGPDDKPDQARAFTCVLGADGTFELVASGGEVPAGRYQVAIQAVGKTSDQLKTVAGPNSPVRRDLRPGPNELVIDVANPSG
jgi:hypothetical protein